LDRRSHCSSRESSAGVDASAAVPGVPIAAALEEYRGARASEWPAPAD